MWLSSHTRDITELHSTTRVNSAIEIMPLSFTACNILLVKVTFLTDSHSKIRHTQNTERKACVMFCCWSFPTDSLFVSYTLFGCTHICSCHLILLFRHNLQPPKNWLHTVLLLNIKHFSRECNIFISLLEKKIKHQRILKKKILLCELICTDIANRNKFKR